MTIRRGVKAHKESTMKATRIWFSDHINPCRALSFTEYRASSVTGRRLGFIRQAKYTKLIDLQRSEEEILAGFSPDTRRLIRRAEMEGVLYEESKNVDDFVRFFNTFARQKKLSLWLNAERLRQSGDTYRITRALKEGEVLFAHLYLCNEKHRRAVLFCSASGRLTSVSKAVISSANRGLHYFDMRLLKAGGFHVYDMGGYALATKNPSLKKINYFKDQFGGSLVCETNYRSIPFYAVWVVSRIYYRALTRVAARMTESSILRHFTALRVLIAPLILQAFAIT